MLKSDQNWDFREYFALHQQQILYKPGTAILPDVGWSISKIRPLWATWERDKWARDNYSCPVLHYFLEAINSLSSQRPHKFTILTDFFNTETSFILPKKNKVNSSVFIMKGNGSLRMDWCIVDHDFDYSYKHMFLNLVIKHNYIKHNAIHICILILVL